MVHFVNRNIKFILVGLVFLCFVCWQAGAQNNIPERYRRNTYSTDNQERENGNIRVIQDERLTNVVKKHLRLSHQDNGVGVWRIQLYFGHIKDDANKKKQLLLDNYVELAGKCEMEYEPPNFRTVVGCFIDEIEAYKFNKELLKDFPDSYRIKQSIPFSELKEKEQK
ncbi:hypothetical protein ACFLSI_02580 [Bacteroidota bacterium]